MKQEITKLEYEQMVALANKASTAYYKDANPIMTDKEFDDLYAAITHYEEHIGEVATDSPTQRPGSDLVEGTPKIAHKHPMISLKDVFDIETLEDKILAALDGESVKLSVSPKLDGVAVSAVYFNGTFKHAVTRGDGSKGEDITDKFKHAKSLLKTENLSGVGYEEVRGEFIIPIPTFIKINESRAARGLDLRKNPRNLVAGVVRSSDPLKMAENGVVFVPYQLISDAPRSSETHSVMQLGTLSHVVCSLAELRNYIDTVDPKKSNHYADYPTDGVVIKLDDVALQEELGANSTYLKWAWAYKFAADEETTEVLDIITQVGRTGAITPVAKLRTVQLAGTDVSSATLHNQSEIDALGINIGAKVVVQKCGEIIPGIVRVEDNPSGVPFSIMGSVGGRCPSCDTKLEEVNSKVMCLEPSCKSKRSARLEFFAGRKQMNIPNVGKELSLALTQGEDALVKHPLDILYLSKEDLAATKSEGSRNGLGALRARAIVNRIKELGDECLSVWIAALGIPGISHGSAHELSKFVPDLQTLLTGEFVHDVLGGLADVDTSRFGVAKAEKFLAWLVSEDSVMVRSLAASINPKSHNFGKEVVEGALTGKKIAITGKLPKSRDVYVKLIETNGGVFAKSIAASTTMLVLGDKPGKSKTDKAAKLGIPTTSLGDFLDSLVTERA